MRKAKPKMEVEFTGIISEVLFAEFQSMRQELAEIKKDNKTTHTFLEQVITNQGHPPRLLNDKDLMFMFNVCAKTLQNYRAAGKISYVKIGDKIYYTQQHIDEFIERHDSKNINKMVD
ncbi:MAG: helix-turn-helix domain-containing protein, partial [Paludibacter sp.]